MKKIVLLYRDETPSVARVIQRLQDHFGQRRVVAVRERLPAMGSDGVVVVMLSETASAGENVHGGLPLDDFTRLASSGVDAVFVREGTVVPVLLDGAVMPPYAMLPEPIRKLAFRHALPIRRDEELDRDLGRLITDLEVHLQYSPAKVYPWDFWLVPIGMAGSVICLPFLCLWLIDVWYWNYGYASVQRYREACFWLTWLGPLLLGAFLLLAGLGFAFRRYRRQALQCAEHFRTGTGIVPAHDDPTASAALILAGVSIGWGWWAGGLAILLAGIAVARRACGFSPRIHSRAILVTLAVALLASLWALWRSSVAGRFEQALSAYEIGIAAQQEGRLAEAQSQFEAAIRAFPRFGHPYQGLALVYARQDQPEAACRELSNAISHYPTGSRGVFAPDRDMVAAAYRNRAKVATKLGQDAQAELDNTKASQLSPFLDIFAGILRWW